MRRTSFITLTLLASSALAAGFANGASAKKGATQLSCALELVAEGIPNPTGTHSGTVECPDPFGSGTHASTYTVTPTGMGTGTIAAEFTNTYHRGTASGTAAMTFTATATGIVYSGTVTYTGGTRKFKHVQGGGTIECTSTDRGAHKSCTVTSTLSGI